MKRIRILLAPGLIALGLTPAPAAAAVDTFANAVGPRAVAATPEGGVVIAEPGAARVRVLSSTGSELAAFGSKGTAPGQFGGTADSVDLDVAAGPFGDIYVADSSGDWVNRFSSAGAFVSRWGNPATAVGEPVLSSRLSIAADAGRVFVGTDQEIHSYDATGSYLGSWDVMDAGARPLNIVDVAAADGKVYVLAGDRITIYSGETGELLDRWGTTLSGPAGNVELFQIQHISASADNVFAQGFGHLFKLSTGGSYLEIWQALGQPEEFLEGASGPGPIADVCMARRPYIPWGGPSWSLSDAAVGPNQRLFVAAPDTGEILLIDQRPQVRVFTNYNDGRAFRTGEQVILDARWSRIPFGALARFEWDLNNDGLYELDGGTDPVAKPVYGTAGTYTVNVRVTSAAGGVSQAPVTFQVDESTARVYPWLFEGQTTVPGEEVKFDTGGDGGSCGVIEKWEWDFDGDGVYEESATDKRWTLHTFTEVGTYVIRARITRGGGRQDLASYTHRVVAPTSPEPSKQVPPTGLSINGGAEFTNDPDVTVGLIGGNGIGSVFLANDGGFKGALSTPVAATLTWRLDVAGRELLPRKVYARFEDGTTLIDDITLDTRDPVVTKATASRRTRRARAAARKRNYRVEVNAKDRLSGVGRMQVAASKKRPGPWKKFARRIDLRAPAGSVFVRVRDRAGNASKWRRVELR